MGARLVYQIATPFSEDELFDIGFEQSADVMFLAHLNHPPQRLARYGHTDWRMGDAWFGSTTSKPTNVSANASTPSPGTVEDPAYPEPHVYRVTSINGDTGQESLASDASNSVSNDLGRKGNTNTVTWTATAGTLKYNVYKSVNGVFGYVGTSTTTSFTDKNIVPDLSLTPSLENRQPFSASASDRPARVTFHQQRTVWGRTGNRPNAIYASRSADIQNLNVAEPVRDDDAWSLALVARQVNTVQHLVPLKDLLVLTTDAVFSISGGEGPITPTSYEITPESYRGAARVRPAVADDVVFYSAAKGGAIRTLGYQFEADGYRGNNITVFAPDFFRDATPTALAWAESPYSVMWTPTTRGDVLALTWQAEQDVWGWTLCETDGFVEDAVVVNESGQDIAYFVVRRTRPDTGATLRSIERTARQVEDEQDAVQIDCARTYEGGPASILFGLHHLNGFTVSALADGVPLSGLTVTDGRVTLPQAASKVHVGLPFTPWIRTLPLAQPGRDGSTKGKPQVIAGAVVSVVATRGVEIAAGRDRADPTEPPTSDNEALRYDEVKTRTGEPYGRTPWPYTGDLLVPLEAGDWREASVVVRQPYPLPMTITAITPDLQVGG